MSGLGITLQVKAEGTAFSHIFKDMPSVTSAGISFCLIYPSYSIFCMNCGFSCACSFVVMAEHMIEVRHLTTAHFAF